MTNTIKLDAILTAAIFAARKHQGKVRKDKNASPYITHPLSVARAIYKIGKVHDQTILVAAILHDTIEDTETTEDELSEGFGEDVLGIVLEVSDDKNLPKMRRKQLQVIHAADLSEQARILKLADKLINCQDVLHAPPSDWSLKKRQEYFQWAWDVVSQIYGINAYFESAFDELLAEAERKLNFHLEPFETVDQRPWGPNAADPTLK